MLLLILRSRGAIEGLFRQPRRILPAPVRPSEPPSRPFNPHPFRGLPVSQVLSFPEMRIRAKLILETSKLRVIAGAEKISFFIILQIASSMGYNCVDMLKWSRAAAFGDPRASANGKIRQIGQPLHLAAHRRHDIEDQSGEEAQETDDDQSDAEHGRRKPGHEPGLEISLGKRNRERDGDTCRRSALRRNFDRGRGCLLRVGIRARVVGSSPLNPEDVDGRRACREAGPYGRRARLERHIVGQGGRIEVDKFGCRPACSDDVGVP